MLRRPFVTIGVVAAVALAGCGGGEHEGRAASAAGVPLEPVTALTTTTATAAPLTAPRSAVVPETLLPVAAALGAPPPVTGPFTIATARPDRPVVELFDAPDGNPKPVELVQTNPEFFGNPRTFLVTRGGPQDPWLEVLVQTRPNHTRAWIRADDVTVGSVSTQVQVSVGQRRLVAYDGASVLADTSVVVGTDATPTPLGLFFISDRTRFTTPGVYGPYALGLNGFSEALATFDGALPQTALHGTNQPQLVGQARSNGCIRVPNEVIGAIAERLPLGTPVFVSP